MAERIQYVDTDTYLYSGLYNADDFIRLIHKWSAKNNYVLMDSSASGSSSDASLSVSKSYSLTKELDFRHGYEFDLSVKFNNFTDEVVELEGVRYNFNKGKVEIVLNGYLATWLEHPVLRKEKGIPYLLKRMFRKFIWKSSKERYHDEIVHDAHLLMDEIRLFFEAQQIITTGEANEKAPIDKRFKQDTP